MQRRNLLLPMLLAISWFASPADLASQSGVAPAFSSGRLWRSDDLQGAESGRLNGGILGDGSKDHRYTGMWIGLGTGAGLIILGQVLCTHDESGCGPDGRQVLHKLTALGVLGITGALIGGLIPKDPPFPSGP